MVVILSRVFSVALEFVRKTQDVRVVCSTEHHQYNIESGVTRKALQLGTQ
jgi:hypothetical protein